MNDQVEVEAVLEKLRDWLEDARALGEGPDGLSHRLSADQTGPEEDFGLIHLVEEFTALKHELKLQTKNGRSLIEQNEGTLSALRQALEQVKAGEAKEVVLAWNSAKALASAFADLDESLLRARREVERARAQIADLAVENLEATIAGLFKRQPWFRRGAIASYHHQVITAIRADRQLRHQLFDSFLEGFGLIHNRLRRVMASEQITHIACEGLEVDPDLMTVVELVDEPKDRPGTVAKELRRGYTWQGRILRFAEVQAVRAGPKALAEFAGAETRKSEEPPLGADDQAETTDGPAVLAEGPTP